MLGKKIWTWGTDPAGSIWVDKLTDKDGQYVEFQAGRFETQMEHERRAIAATGRTADFREGADAFLSKRPPKFRGC